MGHPGGGFLQALGATELRYGVGGFNTDHESMRGHTGGSGQKLKVERAEGRGHLQGDWKKDIYRANCKDTGLIREQINNGSG